MIRRRALFACVSLFALSTACTRSGLDTDLFGGGGSGTGAGPDAGGGGKPGKVDKIDVLLVVDNSPNTAVPHDLLSRTVPYLIDRLTRPACVNGLGNVVAVTPSPNDPCPVGVRDFAPVEDIHLGIVTSSLGGHGADVCSPASTVYNPTQNDMGHLIDRGLTNPKLPTYDDKGFLKWDPKARYTPPGDDDAAAMAVKFEDMVLGTRDSGCGFEAPLEAMYRFLIDPNPYSSIQIVNTKAELMGTDDVLLQQRADFLRPDSALVVVLATDEDDCSTKEGGQFYFSNQALDLGGAMTAFRLPRARAECAGNPNDPCCASCGQATPTGCPPDQGCMTNPALTALEDPLNLRCFDQKRRFGIDFLYPPSRYVKGLTEATVADRAGNIVDNPIFAGGRLPEHVFVAGIVGVPWQDIAQDPKILATGLKPAKEVPWDLLVPGPAGEPPGDPLMIASIGPRSGQNPVTGAPLAPPGGGFYENPINGHERDVPLGDDLQYTCIYRRPSPAPCMGTICFCNSVDIPTNPLCQAPDGTYSNTEWSSRALPGTRPLQMLRDLGGQAVVASICADVVDDPSKPTFGYKPAVDALLHAVRRALP